MLLFFNPWDEEIFIPETHDPFGNCIPVRVTKQYSILTGVIGRIFDTCMFLKIFLRNNSSNQSKIKNFL